MSPPYARTTIRVSGCRVGMTGSGAIIVESSERRYLYAGPSMPVPSAFAVGESYWSSSLELATARGCKSAGVPRMLPCKTEGVR